MPHLHTALIRWNLREADFLARRYSRAHTWTFDGGAVVRASSSPHVVPLPMSDASAVDPEEAFVASLASCQMLWFLDIAARAGHAVEAYEDAADGRMGRNAAGKLVVDLVTLRPRARFAAASAPDAATLAALHHQAHEECFLANSVRCEIRCEPVADS
jgi:organic hydroperoxide reductase OsmC/OhrA